MSLNTITILGRLVDEPKFKQTNSGISVCTFTVACDRDSVPEGGQKTDFIDCVAWRKTGEFINRYFNRGKPILVQGRLSIRSYQDKDGNKRKATEVVVNSADFAGGNKFDRNAVTVAAPTVTPAADVTLDEIVGGEELPWEDHDLP